MAYKRSEPSIRKRIDGLRSIIQPIRCSILRINMQSGNNVWHSLEILFTGLRTSKSFVSTCSIPRKNQSQSQSMRLMDLHEEFKHFLSGNNNTVVWSTVFPISDLFGKEKLILGSANASMNNCVYSQK